MKDVSLELVKSTRLIAIIRLDDLSQAKPLTQALLDAGIRIIEFTLSNPDAIACVEKIKTTFPIFSTSEALIGLGSITKEVQVRDAITAGADLIVSPILNIKIIEMCQNQDVLTIPGAMTPTEIHTAWQAGAELIKVFPVEGFGPHYIKSVLAPMPFLPLVPTGGIGLNNIQSYLAMGATAVGVGSTLIDKEAFAQKDWSAVTEYARFLVNLVGKS